MKNDNIIQLPQKDLAVHEAMVIVEFGKRHHRDTFDQAIKTGAIIILFAIGAFIALTLPIVIGGLF